MPRGGSWYGEDPSGTGLYQYDHASLDSVFYLTQMAPLPAVVETTMELTGIL